MNMKKKEIENIAKTIAKNYLSFSRKIFNDSNFSTKLQNLLNKYGDQEKIKSVIPSIVSFDKWKANNYESILKSVSSKSARRGLVVVNAFDVNRKSEFFKSISDFLTEFDLGSEWKNTLITLVTTGEFYPPNKNFYIGRVIYDKKRVMITLNPDTSLEDLAYSWNLIKGFQKYLWPDFKKTNFTKKSIAIFQRIVHMEVSRVVRADTENREKISFYDERFYNPSDLDKSELVINEIRAKRRLGGDRNAKPIKLKSRLTLKKIVGGNHKKGNRKNYNNLIQQRRRLGI